MAEDTTGPAPRLTSRGPRRRGKTHWRGDSGQISGWLIKVVVGLVVVGLTVFEVGSVLFTRLTARSTASKVAQEAGFTYTNSQNRDNAATQARIIAEEEGTELVEIQLDTSERKATATVQKVATTIFIHRIGPLEQYVTATASESAPFPP